MKNLMKQRSISFILFCLCLFAFASLAKAENIVEPPKTIPKLLKDAAINLDNRTLAPEYKLTLDGEYESLKEYLYYFVDTKADLRIESVSNPSLVSDFSTQYNIKAQGTTWVRLLIAPFDLVGNEVPYFDMGENIQGEKNVWIKPKYLDAVKKDADEYGYFSIEELRHGGEIYMAIQGLPSIWFEPSFVHSEQGADRAETVEFVLMILLSLLTLIALLTAYLSKRTWRIALLIFSLCCLVINFFGLPVTPKGQIIPSDIATLFAVAIALFSLGIVFKEKLKIAEHMKFLDLFFLLLSIIGLFIPFVVLMPSFAWCVRYIELWQVYALVYFIMLFPLLFMNVFGALVCIFANFLLLTSVGLALATLSEVEILAFLQKYNLDEISLLPLIGQVLAILFLVFSREQIPSLINKNKVTSKTNALKKNAKKVAMPTFSTEDEKSTAQNEAQNEAPEEFVREETSEKVEEGDSFTLNTEKIEKNTETENEASVKKEIKTESLSLSSEKVLEEKKQVSKKIEVQERIKIEERVSSHEEKVEAKFLEMELAEKIDNSFRPSIENIMRDICFLENQIKENTPVDAIMKRLGSVASNAKDISSIVKELPFILEQKIMRSLQQRKNEAFDLEELIKEVYARLRKENYSQQIALSWMKAPHVGRFFVGDREYFYELLFALMADSMRATQKGSVYLRVQRDSCSNNPGRLSFIIGDSGSGNPPLKRTSSLLTHVWELSADYYGDFYVEHTAKGLEYSFTLSFIALEDDGVTEKLVSGYNAEKKTRFDKVLILSENPKQKYMLAFRLSQVECHVIEAMNIEDAYVQFMQTQPSVLIVDTTIENEKLQILINEIHFYEKEHQTKQTIILGLYDEVEEKEDLERAGCHTTLGIKEGREAFKYLVEDLLTAYKNVEEINEEQIEELSTLSKEETQNNKENLKFIPLAENVKAPVKERKKFKFVTSKAKSSEINQTKPDFVNFNIDENKNTQQAQEVELNPAMVSYETLPEEASKEGDKN